MANVFLRLRNELNEVQLVRRHLLEENNDMQKKLNYENDAIPRMEKELKVLADENNYLKLLCKYLASNSGCMEEYVRAISLSFLKI